VNLGDVMPNHQINGDKKAIRPLTEDWWRRLSTPQCMLFGAFGLVLLLIPFLVQDIYFIHLINLSGIGTLLALGLNLVLGFTGQISIGQAAYYAVGAYLSALLATRLGFPFWVNLPVAGLIAALCAIIFGPVLRLRGHFLAIATIAFGEIVRIILLSWDPVTNGPRGIIGIPHPKIMGFTFGSDARYYYIILFTVAISFLIVYLIIHSRTGRALRAIRDDQDAAWTSGIAIHYYKTLAFALGGFFSGLGGSLYAHLTGYISPEIASFSQSVQVLMMVVVGGMGSITGSALGALAIVIVPEYLRVFEHLRLIVYSIVLLLMIIYAPKGLAGLFGSISKKILSEDQKKEE